MSGHSEPFASERKMLPGQQPYTDAEWQALQTMIDEYCDLEESGYDFESCPYP